MRRQWPRVRDGEHGEEEERRGVRMAHRTACEHRDNRLGRDVRGHVHRVPGIRRTTDPHQHALSGCSVATGNDSGVGLPISDSTTSPTPGAESWRVRIWTRPTNDLSYPKSSLKGIVGLSVDTHGRTQLWQTGATKAMIEAARRAIESAHTCT